MAEVIEIKGGAGEFEAAVIGIVLDHLAQEENAARSKVTVRDNGIPTWMRATPQLLPGQLPPIVTPRVR